METILHAFFTHNGRPVDRRYYLPEVAGGRLVVYEVLRLVDGIPLFLEDHCRRLVHSVELVGHSLTWSSPAVAQSIAALVEANHVRSGNIKLQVRWDGEADGDLFACFVPHRYPTESEYLAGVPVDLLEAVRENPNAKVANLPVREQADAFIREHQVYEVLLVDREGFVTEGSRSNFFAVREGDLWTPPLTAVLPGITRRKVIDLAEDLALTLKEAPIHRRDLAALEAAFISGTSPGVLPLSRIGDQYLNPGNATVRRLQEAYEAVVQRYVSSRR